MALPTFARPGVVLGPASSYIAGSGTHLYGSSIAASVLGVPTVSKSTSPPTLSVNRSTAATPATIPSRNITRHNTLPTVNAVVLGKVTKLQERQANVSIVAVGEDGDTGAVCADDWKAVIRREDVRGWEVDKVKIEESFRVGDTVRAVVISLGDQSSYYLSTARNELGVLLATSEVGNQMYPISWKEFKDPVTGETEARKVAKPI